MKLADIIQIKTIRFFYEAIVDLVYPPYCIFCQAYLSEGKALFCDTCWDDLPFFPEEHDILNEIVEKSKTHIYIAKIKAIWEFKDNVQFVIHRFKYKHHTWLAKKIANYMIDLIELDDSLKNVDIIIPVPLHKKRKRKRGYNQSTLICKAISKIIDIPINDNSLQRIKNTESQTKLNMTQRMENVANAFRVINEQEIDGKTILLVDDVITTGSTINACAKQLKLGGAKEIFAISAAKV